MVCQISGRQVTRQTFYGQKSKIEFYALNFIAAKRLRKFFKGLQFQSAQWLNFYLVRPAYPDRGTCFLIFSFFFF